MSAISKTLINKRLLAILFLGFSSGLPLALTGSTLQAWFTQAHINIVAIGALTLLGVPYTLKFIWAPLMDHFKIPRLGRRRGWILLTQISLSVALLILANMDPSKQAVTMGAIALLVAFFSASQDVAIDAYRTDVLMPEERGLGASYFVFTYRLAMLFTSGIALIFAEYIGWKLTYEIMAVSVLLSSIPTLVAPPTAEIRSESSLVATIKGSINDLLQRENIILLLLFVILYKIGDAFALSLMMTFLLKGLGFTLVEVGFAYKIMSVVATILGCFIGGVMLTRWNLFRALLIFGLAQSFSNLTFVGLSLVDKNFTLMSLSIFIENFCSGLSTAAFLAFMMTLCNHRFSATQFALLSAIATFGRVFLGPLAGLLVTNVGWTQFYIWAFLACFPGIILLLLLKTEVSTHAHAVAD